MDHPSVAEEEAWGWGVLRGGCMLRLRVSLDPPSMITDYAISQIPWATSHNCEYDLDQALSENHLARLLKRASLMSLP